MDHSHVLRFARAVMGKATGEPVAWRISGPFGWTYQEEPPYDAQRGRVAEPLYATPPDHREAMRMALDALEVGRRYVYADDRPQLENAIDALREALASDAMDRLAQADRELGLGERSDG
jgi:hypothetical protein